MCWSTIERGRYVKYCMKRVALLRQHDITPVLVFDGAYLPSKAIREAERELYVEQFLSHLSL